MTPAYEYVIVGGGLAGASAVQGIRERDPDGRILLASDEVHLPYDRPPLSKKLWTGQQKLEEVFLHDREFYKGRNVILLLDARAVKLEPNRRVLVFDSGEACEYRHLLLATGCQPRRLEIPGADLDGINYFRSLDDYLHLSGQAAPGKSAVVVGGGFIGSEIAAALNMQGVQVTMVFPAPYLCDRVFPESLARAVQQHYAQKGITILAPDQPASFARKKERFVTRTTGGKTLESDMLVIGVGVVPDTALAKSGGLETGNGIVTDEYLETSQHGIYAAGDAAFFPYRVLGQSMRIEHWDNALNQGLCAGRNMAGAREPYDYQPYFYSDLFEFGYEATGEVNSSMQTFADWEEENKTGVIYYLREGRVRGVMMCNVWDRMEAARELIRSGQVVEPEQLRGWIRS